MNLETYAMMGAGIASLVAGFLLVRARFRAASGADRVLVLGPVFEAVALAVFAAEHFTAAQDLMGIVPRWLPPSASLYGGLCTGPRRWSP